VRGEDPAVNDRHRHSNFRIVFVSGLPRSVNSDERVRGIFEEFGEVMNSRIVLDELGNPRHGFCRMRTHLEALEAIAGLNGREIGGGRRYYAKVAMGRPF
jgi:RNA recognition motif-containing protein